jgi:hypothetical protein
MQQGEPGAVLDALPRARREPLALLAVHPVVTHQHAAVDAATLAVESIVLGFGQQTWKNVRTDHALSVPSVEPDMRILCVPAEAAKAFGAYPTAEARGLACLKARGRHPAPWRPALQGDDRRGCLPPTGQLRQQARPRWHGAASARCGCKGLRRRYCKEGLLVLHKGRTIVCVAHASVHRAVGSGRRS